MQTLKFGLDEFEPVTPEINEDYEEAKQSRFAKVKIRLFGDGANAHTEPVDFETLKASADSAYDIPLIAELNPYDNENDFGGHGTLTGKEFSFGFVKESKENPIIFEKDENGKTFITLYGLIWKKYFSNVVEIIKDRGNEVEVSVELDIVKGKMSKKGKPIMKQFILNAITFLGKVTTAACQGAEATLCFSNEDKTAFDLDKKEYLEKHFGNIVIDNTKESAIDGKWSNPRQKLLTPILNATNKTALLNEAYLFWKDEGDEGITLSDVSYPHHLVKGDKLVLQIRGVQAAFSRLAQQGEVKGKAKAHLLRHYKELGLNTDNFESFGLSKEQFELLMDITGKEENAMIPEEKITEEKEMEVPEECKEECVGAEIEEEKPECDEKMDEDDHCDDCKEDDEKDSEEDKKEMSSDDGIPPQEPLKTADEVTVEDLLARIEKLSAENEAYLEKINSMCDYEDLKIFKEEYEARELKEKEMAEMEKVLSCMEEKGIGMSDETRNELIQNRQNFSNIDAWSNYVKAYAFDNYEVASDGVVKFAIPDKREEDNKMGSWASLNKKYN